MNYFMSLDPLALFRSMPGAFAQGMVWGLMALGVYITYRLLDFADLTVDGSLCTGGAVCIMMMLKGQNVWVSMVAALLAGMAAGCVTGLLHTFMGIPAILSGILTQLGLYSINLKIMGKANQAISVMQYDVLVSLRYIPHACLLTTGFCIVIIALLYWFFGTEIGASVRATGCNPNMARAQGINTNATKVLGLVISNGLVGLAGALYAQYQGSADINMGRGAIVIGLAAVIIGEVVFGKIFHNFALHMVAVVIGAIIYFVVIAIVLQLGLETTDLKLFSSLIVALFLALPYLKSKYFTPADKKGGNGNA